jgi:glycosyltransferase involved in cell wall biosynthesis
MKRVLIVHSDINPPGGDRAVAAWTIEALREEHRIGVLSWVPPRLECINAYYGTSLRSADFAAHLPAVALRRVIPPGRLNLWKYNYLLRLSQRLRPPYDVVIGTDNEADFGRHGVQYIHYPRFGDDRVFPGAESQRDDPRRRWYHRSRPIMRAYFRLCGLGTGFSFERMRRNLTLVNSEWTRNKVQQILGIDAVTLYPPVPTDFPSVPWEAREHGFVCVGRIAPEKETESIIALLSAVRARGYPVHLHVIGSVGDAAYYERITRLQRAHADWVSVECDHFHAAMAEVVARHRYGIHAMRGEHFGIGVAEMLNAGCVVFVRDDGGPIEIVGDDPDLVFHGPDDAADKIAAVLGDEARLGAVRRRLAARRQLFSTVEFMRQMRAVVEQFPG